MCVGGTERMKKEEGKRKAGGGSRNREDILIFFFKADVSLLWLCSKQAQLLVPTLSAKA